MGNNTVSLSKYYFLILTGKRGNMANKQHMSHKSHGEVETYFLNTIQVTDKEKQKIGLSGHCRKNKDANINVE